MSTVLDVARYMLDCSGPMTTMKLHKLCYLSQGWSLAWDYQLLFEEPFQAWAHGPMCPTLSAHHVRRFTVSAEDIPGFPELLSQTQLETIDAVLEAYGDSSGRELSHRTSWSRPWLEARVGVSPGQACTNEISIVTMQDYFVALSRTLKSSDD